MSGEPPIAARAAEACTRTCDVAHFLPCRCVCPCFLPTTPFPRDVLIAPRPCRASRLLRQVRGSQLQCLHLVLCCTSIGTDQPARTRICLLGKRRLASAAPDEPTHREVRPIDIR